MEEGKYDSDLDKLKEAANSLGEHFDAVMIFCSRCESGNEDGTLSFQWGAGNYYARHGQIALWMEKQKLREAREL